MRYTSRLAGGLLGVAAAAVLTTTAFAQSPPEPVTKGAESGAVAKPQAVLPPDIATTGAGSGTVDEQHAGPPADTATRDVESRTVTERRATSPAEIATTDAESIEVAPSVEESQRQASAQVLLNDSGLRIRSADNRYTFGLNAFTSAVYTHNVNDSDDAYLNGFALRNFRTTFRAGFNDRVNLTMTLDVGAAYGARPYDAFIELKPHDRVRFRVGLQKALVNVEQAQSPTAMLFFDRSLVSTLSPYRDVGVVMEVQPVDAFLLELGVFNGADDVEVYSRLQDDTLEFQARAQFVPTIGREPGRSFLRLGVATTTGPVRGSSASRRLGTPSSTGGRAFIDFAPGVFADGNRTRATAFFVTGHEGLYVQGEYLVSSTSLRDALNAGHVVHHAWHLAAAYAFGGLRTWGGVVPRQNLFEGGLGALELKARVHQVQVRQRGGAFLNRNTVEGSSNRDEQASSPTIATGLGAGASWWWNPSVRLQADYGWTTVRNPAAGDTFSDEHLLRLSLIVAL